MTCYPFLERYITISISGHLRKERERGKPDPVNFRKDFWIVIRDREKIGQKLIGAEQIAASVPYSFLKWRIPNFLSSLVVDRREGLGMRMGH